jgi:phosphoserine phosphatase
LKVLICDLDGTLIRGDSFRLWAIRLFLYKPHVFIVNFLKVRKNQFRARLKISCILTFEQLPSKKRSSLSTVYAEKISKKFSGDFWTFYERFLPDKVLILSASPNIYVERIGEINKFEAVGTDLIDGKYILMSGIVKRDYAKSYLSDLGVEKCLVLALGNSRDDLPFMDLADSAIFICWDGRSRTDSMDGVIKLSWKELSEVYSK